MNPDDPLVKDIVDFVRAELAQAKGFTFNKIVVVGGKYATYGRRQACGLQTRSIMSACDVIGMMDQDYFEMFRAIPFEKWPTTQQKTP